MSFVAGVMSLQGTLEEEVRTRFAGALAVMESEVVWPIQRLESEGASLVQGAFGNMWQGPAMASGQEYDAVACGVQWKETPSSSALQYLVEAFTSEQCEIDNHFDFFNCAVLEKGKNRVILGTDPLGLAPFLYKVEGEHVFFSTHQTFFKFLCFPHLAINWQAVFEILVIGHAIGNKTLLRDVNALPPGCRLLCRPGGSVLQRYASLPQKDHVRAVTLPEAVDILYEHLADKCYAYARFTPKPIAAFLSGGWDSRLLASMFSSLRSLAITFTSQQQLRFHDRLISEKKIARQVADYLHVGNRFVAPVYRSPRTRDKRARMLDYCTWFHDWAFTLSEHLPRDEFVFCDGLLGDVLLRGLFVTSELHRCAINEDRQRAVEILHSQYIRGFNTYTRGIEEWKSVIEPALLDRFARMLMEELSEEIHSTNGDEFVTFFFLRNRSRRGISPLPRLILGRKGGIFFPFSDPGFLQKALSIPADLRRGFPLYRELLERSKPGLSLIPSTNSGELRQLAPYLIDSVSELSRRAAILRGTKKCFPWVYTRLMERKRERNLTEKMLWVDHLMENPPRIFMDVLTAELKASIRRGDRERISASRYFLDRILMLEGYFS